jgi:lysophospholipase L1-like esterase
MDMEKIRLFVWLFAGLAIMLAGIFLRLPVTLNYLSYLETLVVKYGLVVFGLVVFVVNAAQLVMKKPLSQGLSRNFWRFVLLLVIFFVIVEASFQLVSKPSVFYYNHPVYHHALIPNASGKLVTSEFSTDVKINSLGLRNDEIGNKTKYRILMVGDSFTWGYGVRENETFPRLLETVLGSNYEVINAGATSYSPLLEYLYLKNDGLRLRPDMVVLNFDMSDVADDRVYGSMAVFNGTDPVRIAVPAQNPDVLTSVLNNIKTVKVLKGLIETSYSNLRNKPTMENSEYAGNLAYDKYAIMRFTNDTYEADWNRTLEYIDRINSMLKERNITFVLVVYPYGNQVDGQEWWRGRFTFSFSEGVTYSVRPVGIIEEFGRRENITVINAFPEFKNSTVHPLFLAYDGHFNQKGHELLANVLYNKLKIILRG